MESKNSTEALDLYSKIEDILDIKDEAAPKLYAHYILALKTIEFDTLLDLGCGSGGFLQSMMTLFPDTEMSGIDLSPAMVSRARADEVDAECIDICDLGGSYDVITATFDVVNYLDGALLGNFMQCISKRLKSGGYCMCDINTLYGFEEVAVGSFIADRDEKFLSIDSDYENGIYSAEFTLFESTNGLYKKSQEQMFQYYHTPDEIAKAGGLELISSDNVFLYGDECDKLFLVFKKN